MLDELIPEYIRISRYLTPNAASAESLARATLQIAVERAGTWDPQTGLRPWIIGILVERAALARLVRARIESPGSVAARPSESPSLLPAFNELLATYEQALTGVSEGYRIVLQRRLIDGESPGQVATELAWDCGRVAAALRAGLLELRRQLPTTHCPGIADDATAPRGSDEFRRDVLAHAVAQPRG